MPKDILNLVREALVLYRLEDWAVCNLCDGWQYE